MKALTIYGFMSLRYFTNDVSSSSMHICSSPSINKEIKRKSGDNSGSYVIVKYDYQKLFVQTQTK